MLCTFLCLMLLALTGCQTVSEVDLGKALTNAATVQSGESSSSVTVEIEGSGKAEAGIQSYIEQLKKLTVNLQTKTQDKDHSSIKGEIVLPDAKLPFQLSTNKESAAILFDGATKPLVFDTKGLASQAAGANIPTGGLPIDLGVIAKDPQAFVEKLIPVLAKDLPNLPTISVSQTTEQINNESIALNKVHAELKGTEVAGLVKQLLSNLIADEQGLRDIVKLFLDQKMSEGGLDFSGIAVEFIKPMLQEAQQRIDGMLAAPEVAQILNDKLSLKTDLYLDKDLQLRKMNFDLSLGMPAHEEKSITAIKVSGTTSVWNIGKPVTADVIDTSKGSLAWTQDTKMVHFLKTLDAKSALYDVLANKAQVLKRELHLSMTDDGLPVPGTTNPFIREGNTMVPVRFVTESLDSDVSWNGDKQEVTVIDIMTGKKVVLTIGSKDVYVDGKLLTGTNAPEVAPELIEGSTFVPGAFLARLFGATTAWDNATRIVTIKKN